MKNQYILGLIAGASLMLALIVLTAADDDFKYQILTIKIGDNDLPAFLFNKETGKARKTNT